MRAIALRLPGRSSLPLVPVTLVLFLAFFAVLSGAAIAWAGTLALFAFGGVVIGAAALVVPLRWLVVALLVMSLIVTGQIMYFGGIFKAHWIPFLTGLLLLIRYPIDLMQRNKVRAAVVDETPWSVRAMRLSIAIFFATLFASTLINYVPPIQILVISKEYVFLWGVYLILATGLVRPEFVERIWAWLPWLLPLQLPLVLYQRFVVMSRTRALAKWDVIVGAFGGNPEGGGASGAMGFFCLIGIFIAIYRYRAGLLLRWQMLSIVAAGIISIGLAEVKFMILLLPFCFIMVFSKDILRKPIQGILLIGLGFILSVSIFVAYKVQYSNQLTTPTTEKYLESMFFGQTETSFVNVLSHNQSRLGAIAFWFKNHSLTEPVSLLIGQGMGSSRITMTFVGEAQAQHFEALARSSVTILLWEAGAIGTLAYIGFMCFAFLAAKKRSMGSQCTADSRATLQSMAIAIVILAASLPYNSDLLGTHQIQLLLMLCLGYVAMNKASAAPTSGAGLTT